MTSIASSATAAEELRRVEDELDVAAREQLEAQLAYVLDKSPDNNERRKACNERVTSLEDELKGLKAVGVEIARRERTERIRQQMKDLKNRRTKALQAIDALPALYDRVASMVPALTVARTAYESAYADAVRGAIFGALKGEDFAGRNANLLAYSSQSDLFTPLKDEEVVSVGRKELESTMLMGRRRIDEVFAYQMDRLETELATLG